MRAHGSGDSGFGIRRIARASDDAFSSEPRIPNPESRILWAPFSPDAFVRADREQKPVLLWIVASWARGCAAMEAEILSDPAIAALVNRGFVAVRVDSDERPDVNERYNLGGWPTLAVLTPEGEVLTGGTAFSREILHARLGRSARAMARRGGAIRLKAQDAIRARHDRSTAARGRGPAPDPDAVPWMRLRLLEAFDRDFGGFVLDPPEASEAGLQQKFPHTQALRFLLDLYRTSHEEDVAEALTLSLDGMAAGGLRDPADGGFFRYAERRDWSAPCPDKTVGDSAGLLAIYTEAAQTFSRRDYVDVVRDASRYVRAQLGGGPLLPTDVVAGALKACLPAAIVLGDIPIRDFALARLDRVVLDRYQPGHGVAHDAARTVAGLLTDQVEVAEAALTAHEVTESPVFSMLAEELLRYALRTMWDEETEAFADRGEADAPAACGRLAERVFPLEANCAAASLLIRLGRLTGHQDLQRYAERILRCFAVSYRDEGLLGAPYASAMIDFVQSNPNPESRAPA
ncbi:MAG: thioredoxin domain-containing protein [Acidobacteria bacterium]|nr:thioredoxin domain-containing protein [Acidobacteriota bacterium]